MILKDTVDKNGPQRCMRTDCSSPDEPTERYAVTLMLYSRDRHVHVPIQAHMSLQVCKNCQSKLSAQEFINDEMRLMFSSVTKGSGFPPSHPCRVIDPSRSKIAWRELGRYDPSK